MCVCVFNFIQFYLTYVLCLSTTAIKVLNSSNWKIIFSGEDLILTKP